MFCLLDVISPLHASKIKQHPVCECLYLYAGSVLILTTRKLPVELCFPNPVSSVIILACSYFTF